MAALLLALATLSSPLLEAQVEVLEPEVVAPGARGELSLVLLEAPERDLPLELRLEAEGISLLEGRLDWRAVADPLAPLPRLRARFDAPPEPGRYTVEGGVRYSVCDDRWCRTKTRQVTWIFEVVAPPEG